MGERSNDRRLPILTGRRANAIRRSMLFCSQAFLLFFLAVFAIYWAMPWQRPRIWLLLVASFCFYASWNKWLALLIGVSTTCDYLLARGLERWTRPASRRC